MKWFIACALTFLLLALSPRIEGGTGYANEDPPRLPEVRLLPAGIVKEHTSATLRTQLETNQVYGYIFDKGTAARIESARVRPKTARPGVEIEAILTYVVLTHSRDQVPVTEVREVWVSERLIGRSETEVAHGGGTYESKVSFLLPDSLREGDCKVVYLVRTPHSRDLREARFVLLGGGSTKP